jgi:hypothetical protein
MAKEPKPNYSLDLRVMLSYKNIFKVRMLEVVLKKFHDHKWQRKFENTALLEH